MTRTTTASAHDARGRAVAVVAGVAVAPLRPLHVLELSWLALDHHELTGATPAATFARTRRWAMRLVVNRTPDARAFVITDQRRTVGIAVLDDIRRGGFCSGQVSVWVHREERRRGVGTAAMTALVRQADELGLHRLEAAVLPGDDAARGVLTASGFLPVGLARGYRLVAGRWQDHVLYERLVRSAAA